MKDPAQAVEPVRRSHTEAQRTYDRISRIYDWVEGPFEARVRREGLTLLNPRAGECILDVGNGTGVALAHLISSVGRDGLAVGVDLSKRMQDTTQRRLQRAGLYTPLTVGDGTALPFRSGMFDGVFMSFVLELFDTPEIPDVLGEVRRVLRPGGRLTVVALGAVERPRLMARAYVALRRRLPRLLDCRPIPTREFLGEAAYDLTESRIRTMWGLPVDIVLARLPAAGSRPAITIDIRPGDG